MQSKFIDKKITYTGLELASHWIYDKTELIGDAIVSFIGPANVPTKNMADMVDVKNEEPIFSKLMLHFIVEHFGNDLTLAIARQRLLCAIAAALIPDVKRTGNDLYIGKNKLSVSIASISPVSTLIHFAMNIKSDGTPVPTIGLSDLKIEPKTLAQNIMKKYCEEIESMHIARCKVRAVK